MVAWIALAVSIVALAVAGGAAAITWRADQTVMVLERERQAKNERQRQRRQQLREAKGKQ